MDRKLICFDLDGTLLDRNRRVPDTSYRAIEKLMKEGHEVTIATGRMFKSAHRISGSLPEGVHIVCSNGAVIAHGKEILFTDTIPEDDLAPLYDLTMSHGLGLTFVSLYTAYHTHIADALRYNYFMNRYDTGTFIKNLHLKDRESYKDCMRYFINGIVISRSHPERLKRLRSALEATGRYNIESSASHNVEIIPQNSDKGKGVLKLAKILGIDRKDTIAFGDAENDIKMLRSCGCGIAMGNAPHDVLNCADLITSSNEEDGIVKGLRMIFTDL